MAEAGVRPASLERSAAVVTFVPGHASSIEYLPTG